MATTDTVLTRRALNRATLARQLLLRREDLPVTEVVTRLAGLQAQTTHTWYAGLENRIEGLAPESVGQLLTDGALVRVTLMRGTLHLVTPEDCRYLRPTVQPAIDQVVAHSTHGRATRGLDPDEIAAAGYEILTRAPLDLGQLGARLNERWPDVEGTHLAQVVKGRLPMLQIPPRGVWGASGPAALAPADTWTGLPMDAAPDPEGMVLRYLAAFGPAGVKDAQAWSGLTRLGEVFDRLRDRLVVLRGEDGRELFDLPDAPRPGEDTAAPVRLLYDFDNLLRGHADRSRVISDDDLKRLASRNGMPPATVLVDGEVRASWKVVRTRRDAVVEVVPYAEISGADREQVEAEGLRMLRFLAADRGGHEVRFAPQA
ncbi:winged helix DNA-binding domain-containing protein [Nocardiopsis sp. CT-R113]|uniref:Winged helix DNA-binding domain-containing protein n=1 Tax=Nocardiopsis codii TaxID=3065942 RepID=A0ABU7KA30_9ACTN|nr:winged helix DNA-binding domain-containing protein [Nocardiopsis sp. CT-R113]MEE2039062.1 winged helix DNA-binding domain-containing protein [Nocardiopsis sp. CT-R113]